MANKLNYKQLLFAKLYNGNATETAINAGYSKKTAYSIGQRLLKKVEVRGFIEKRQNKQIKPLIANRERRQKFWSETLEDENIKIEARLKASELLGRSEADFTDKLQANLNVTNISDEELMALLPEAISLIKGGK